jgi:hypothetical protein
MESGGFPLFPASLKKYCVNVLTEEAPLQLFNGKFQKKLDHM